jgi:hypothetical protein
MEEEEAMHQDVFWQVMEMMETGSDDDSLAKEKRIRLRMHEASDSSDAYLGALPIAKDDDVLAMMLELSMTLSNVSQKLAKYHPLSLHTSNDITTNSTL